MVYILGNKTNSTQASNTYKGMFKRIIPEIVKDPSLKKVNIICNIFSSKMLKFLIFNLQSEFNLESTEKSENKLNQICGLNDKAKRSNRKCACEGQFVTSRMFYLFYFILYNYHYY